MLEEYRSLVGKLLYYTVKVGPDCANAIRDLARHMPSPGPEQWKAMSRVVGYLKVKELHGLVMKKPDCLTVINYCDTSYVTDKDLRRSVSGMICTLGGLVVNWSSRTQKTCTLSSTESEYVALEECGQDLKFVCMFLHKLGIGEMPGIIYEDNEGAIFLDKNQQVGMCTKHIDIKYHFVRELIGRNYLDIRYVRSGKNYTDLTTKNVSNEIFEKLFTNSIQIGNIIIKRENVGRIGGVDNTVHHFTYDIPEDLSDGDQSVNHVQYTRCCTCALRIQD